MKRVVIYEKTTRYQYEKQRLGCQNDTKFKELVSPIHTVIKCLLNMQHQTTQHTTLSCTGPAEFIPCPGPGRWDVAGEGGQWV